MDVERIDEGLWRWTGFHQERKQPVGCVYLEAPEAVCLIDPLIPPEDETRFLEALDRDVARLGLPVHVLLTVPCHARSAAELAKRYGAATWARLGDRLPAGVLAFPTARTSEVVFYLPAFRTVVAGDVLLGTPDGELRLCPESWLPQGVGHEQLRTSLQPLLELAVDRVLVAHGEPAPGSELGRLLQSGG